MENQKCPRCRAPVGNKDVAAFEGWPDVCYWAAGQRSEAAYDGCARRAGQLADQLRADYDAALRLNQHNVDVANQALRKRAELSAKRAELSAKRAELSAKSAELSHKIEEIA